MTEPVRQSGPPNAHLRSSGPSGSANLADILERVLDKGIVISGDIQVNLLDIELLTIKLRLLVASVDKAKEMGIDWWERDPTLSSSAMAAGSQRDEVNAASTHDQVEAENAELRRRLAALENTALRAEDGRGEGETAPRSPSEGGREQ